MAHKLGPLDPETLELIDQILAEEDDLIRLIPEATPETRVVVAVRGQALTRALVVRLHNRLDGVEAALGAVPRATATEAGQYDQARARALEAALREAREIVATEITDLREAAREAAATADNTRVTAEGRVRAGERRRYLTDQADTRAQRVARWDRALGVLPGAD